MGSIEPSERASDGNKGSFFIRFVPSHSQWKRNFFPSMPLLYMSPGFLHCHPCRTDGRAIWKKGQHLNGRLYHGKLPPAFSRPDSLVALFNGNGKIPSEKEGNFQSNGRKGGKKFSFLSYIPFSLDGPPNDRTNRFLSLSAALNRNIFPFERVSSEWPSA